MSKTCNKCKLPKSLAEFPKRKASKDGLGYTCKKCNGEQSQDHYRNNRKTYIARSVICGRRNRQKLRQYVYDYLKLHPCIDCGEDDPIVLEFDHKDRNSKRASISNLISYGSLSILKEEIKKCEVRCANCHRRRTAKQFNWYKTVIEQ